MVIIFSDSTRVYNNGAMTTINKDSRIDINNYIQKLTANGGTCLADALNEGLTVLHFLLKTKKLRYLRTKCVREVYIVLVYK